MDLRIRTSDKTKNPCQYGTKHVPLGGYSVYIYIVDI